MFIAVLGFDNLTHWSIHTGLETLDQSSDFLLFSCILYFVYFTKYFRVCTLYFCVFTDY